MFMKKCLVFAIILTWPILMFAQKVTLNPAISPTLFKYNDQITVTYDVTGTSLASLTDAWVWVWIPGVSVDAKYNTNPASSNTVLTNNAKLARTTPSGKVVFSITFKPSDFFATDISTQTQLGILLKGNDWSNGQTTDFITTFWDGSFQVKLVAPTIQPLFVTSGTLISIQAQTPEAADYQLLVNSVAVLDPSATQNSTSNYAYSLTTGSAAADVTLIATASGTTTTSQVSFSYLPSVSSPTVSRPSGIIDGINYNSNDATKVTLGLWAPGKTSVYAVGDFSDWKVLPENLMNRDGEHFWLEIENLISGVEYAYQYLVDETIYVADPYADKLLSTDDQYIPASTYPNLKTFPAKAIHSESYFNWLAIFQTGQIPYNWQVTNFQKPAKEKLNIYELHIRDFFDANNRNYQNLIDTIGYFKKLGINAIELMPIMEFSGNDSWGYNPDFMFAPDKYYGTKNKLKEFIDVCHQNGIAVILDIVLNHQDMFNPYCLMYFDLVNYKPLVSNPWFNVTAPHPYSVFYDLNHVSSYTRKFVDTVNFHWLNEYKVDGFRYDLSKGFTQTVSTESTVGNYDQSRIDNITRMADVIWSNFPDAYVILEHFADNSEETVLANYRVAEGNGMMLWGNFNYAYNQNSMGFSSSSDVSWMYYGNRGWTKPRAVGYMESHDEERLMYKNEQYGNSSGAYSVKDIPTGLERQKAAYAFFLPIPGPKMIWQFGELGYDFSINTCSDGTISNNCRVSAKPVKWDYLTDAKRMKLNEVVSAILNLRNTYPSFQTTDFSLQGGSSLTKQMILKGQPYSDAPSSTDNMSIVVAANFDVTAQSLNVNVPHAGNWFHYFANGDQLSVSATPQSITLQPGEFRIYTDVQLPAPETELTAYSIPNAPVLSSVQQVINKVQLTWQDNSSIETGYNIYRRKTGGTFAKVGTVAADITTFADGPQGLESATQYEYYVEATNPYKSSLSNTLQFTTGTITAIESFTDTDSIYPNPTTGVFNLKEDVIVDGLSIKSMQGVEIVPINLGSNAWDISSFSAGLYIVEVQQNSSLVRFKLIKK